MAVVTGVKIKEAQKTFFGPDPAHLLRDSQTCYKINAPAGAAIELNKAGYFVIMTGYSQAELDLVASKSFIKPNFLCRQVNLLSQDETNQLVEVVTQVKEKTDLPVHLVHYGGASDTSSPLPYDTVFLWPDEIPPTAYADLIRNNCETLTRLFQGLFPLFREQTLTKLVAISAVTSLRTKVCHGLDAAQKGALHSLLRSWALDLVRHNIFVTEVMPGMTDTGFYDNEETFNRVCQSGRELGYEYTEETFPVFSAEAVGEMVRFALDFNGHVRELSALPYGQYPHLGA